MSSLSRCIALALAASTMLSAASREPLRVCSDPNNMPFSNANGEGFENAIAEMVAQELHRPLAYFWWPQRRGFIRNTLDAGRCDLVMAVPGRFERVLTTRPYYRSAYAFVSQNGRGLTIRSFDDARLKRLSIGIQLTGDDYNNPPPAQALASRHIIDNVRGYPVYGDYSKPEPLRAIVDAVAGGTIDLAVMWGPTAGYFASREPISLRVEPVIDEAAGRLSSFAFDIAMGVRRGDEPLRRQLDQIILRRRTGIRRVLTRFGVPLV